VVSFRGKEEDIGIGNFLFGLALGHDLRGKEKEKKKGRQERNDE